MASELKKNFVRNSFWNFIFSVINRGGGLIFSIILAKQLLPEGFGLYSLVTSIAMIFVTFADLGINASLTVFVSKNKDNDKSAAYFRYLLKLKLFMISLIFILLAIFSFIIAPHIFQNPNFPLLMLLCAAYTVIFSLDGFFASLFYIYNRVSSLNIKEVLFQSSRILFFIVVASFLGLTGKIYASVLALLFGIMVSLLFTYFLNREVINHLMRKVKFSLDKKKTLKFILYLSIGGISTVIFSYIDVLILGIFLKETYLGFYRAAGNLVTGILGIVNIFPVLFPLFMALDKKNIENVFNKIIAYSFVITIPLIFGIIFFAKQAIIIIYGAEYAPSVIILQILSLFVISSVMSSLYYVLFVYYEDSKSVAFSTLIASIINTSLNLILIISLLRISPIAATCGAAITTITSSFFQPVFLGFLAKKRYFIPLHISSSIKPIIASIIMIGFLYFINYFISFSWIMLLVAVFLGMLVYFGVLLVIKGIKKEDFIFLLESLLKYKFLKR